MCAKRGGVLIGRAVLAEEHEELCAIAKQILAEIEADGPSDALSGLRWRLNRVLTKHLAMEDRLLYPMLLANRKTAPLAEPLLVDVAAMAEAFASYHAAWPIERIQNEWVAFRTATREILQALRRRILREEHDLFPRVSWPGADDR